MGFLGLPLRNLARRPLRSTLTALGIALAVASFIGLTGLVRGHERAWVQNLLDQGTHAIGVRKGAVEILSTSLDEALGPQLRALPGVLDAAGELVDVVTLDSGRLVVVSGRPLGSYLWRTLSLLDGRVPERDQPRAAVVGEGAAAALGLRAGDRVRLHGADLEVTGIARPTSAMTNNMLFLPLATMQGALGRPGRVTVFNLRLARPEDPAAVAAFLRAGAAALPELTFTEVRAIGDHNVILRLARAMAWGTSTIALAMGLVVVLNTLLMAVTERTREIGVLSALGWAPQRIVALVVLEGLALALIGSAAGTGLGVAGVHWLAGLPQLRGLLEPDVTPRLVAEVAAATLLLGVLGSLYPAWRAARLAPVEALRHE